ncbi:MAG: acetyl-CoA hydrolase [Bdellovibrio sp. CG12_big_fil_rev_8_21_14_0_65_39_13]|nr:MAG: acetyl-CoA hydrolase [Bdellovibrio sp. CG22_combo_CG10-13_8_21_14_all_39_27]PIQ58375.1 MAG: acetyl-CoA hydrolase [Bdellovibrio sp. CG12_big_fil_rev_8_21_14_0_65_39_13]PIR35888.1 MAG: acetyl-CoA hydrolase [Bdellovibrio sp. CG11_big_fil_rev_8_21_14_0_20_39_38]
MNTMNSIIDDVLIKTERKVVLALPLALGKALHFANALYQRACEDQSIDLTIVSALTLSRPIGKSLIEKRFFDPFNERHFGNFPDPFYERDRLKGCLPNNIRVCEFYYPPGKYLGNEHAQRNYISSNYTHAARDIVDRGVNVIAQIIAPGEGEQDGFMSLSCNSDLTLDVVKGARQKGREIIVIGQVNRELPFMFGDARVKKDFFDYILDAPEYEHRLFAPPKLSISEQDYMIALYVSTLIKDGGELQIGIGSLGDAIVSILLTRHQNNADYLEILKDFQVFEKYRELISEWGDTAIFKEGLFGASEMMVDGFIQLIEAGIVKREVFDNPIFQKLLNDHKSQLSQDYLANHQSESGVTQGALVHAAFFLGAHSFYQKLREMPEEQRKKIRMRSVLRVNELFGHEEIDRLHRQHGRFINTCMMTTLTGGSCSDILEDGQVISGVGGQYNFVAQAHALHDARSILMMRATGSHRGPDSSNILSDYGHITIPKHLRDIVVTEYGIANLRGKTDEEIVIELIQITDSRFQQELIDWAKKHQKLSKNFELDERYRHNTVANLKLKISKFKKLGLFQPFPLGCDFTPVELKIGKALKYIKRAKNHGAPILVLLLKAIFLTSNKMRMTYRTELERMNFVRISSFEEWLMSRLLVQALEASQN